MAGKLVRTGGGTSTPRPVTIVFPASQPVYPMRLTALADSPVYLDLFIAADKLPTTPLLVLDRCEVGTLIASSRGVTYSASHPGRPYVEISHPHTSDYLWNKCCLTRLSGVIAPKDMNQDILFEFAPLRSYIRTHYCPNVFEIELVSY